MPTKKANSKKRLAGTERRDRKKSSAGARLARCPSAPAHLSERARLEWKQLAPIAHENGYLGRSDLRAFELLAEALATESEMRAVIAREGITVFGGSGGQKAHPALKAMETARNQATRLLIEFGMTPRSRGSVDPVPQETPRNPFQSLS